MLCIADPHLVACNCVVAAVCTCLCVGAKQGAHRAEQGTRKEHITKERTVSHKDTRSTPNTAASRTAAQHVCYRRAEHTQRAVQSTAQSAAQSSAQSTVHVARLCSIGTVAVVVSEKASLPEPASDRQKLPKCSVARRGISSSFSSSDLYTAASSSTINAP